MPIAALLRFSKLELHRQSIRPMNNFHFLEDRPSGQ
jgi:hypothetical protein